MRSWRFFVLLAGFLATGCAAGVVQEVPITLRYTPVLKMSQDLPLKAVSLGRFRDVRTGRPAGVVGERAYVTGRVDRFRPRGGVGKAVAEVVRGYFAKRKTRVQAIPWDGTPAKLWDQPGPLAVAGRITHLWFHSRDLYTMGEASSILRIELIAGSPKSGAIITKMIQIEPVRKSNLFMNTREIEAWISRTISEAIERTMPDLERRLAG